MKRGRECMCQKKVLFFILMFISSVQICASDRILDQIVSNEEKINLIREQFQQLQMEKQQVSQQIEQEKARKISIQEKRMLIKPLQTKMNTVKTQLRQYQVRIGQLERDVQKKRLLLRKEKGKREKKLSR